MIPNAHQVHVVALILVYSADICKSETRAYKVKDSYEENGDRGYANDFTKGFTAEGNSEGFYGSGFHFPDFFNDGNKDVGGGKSFGFGTAFSSPFPALSESRSSDSTYVVPANTYRTELDYDRRKQSIPISRSAPRSDSEQRSSKKPIVSLYDDWKPGDERSQTGRWSQEHVDDDSAEQSGPRANANFGLSGPYRGQNNNGRPYSETSLKQHYKPLRPVGSTHGTNHGPGEEERTHAHKYNVNHVYDPKKRPDEPYYNKIQEEKLRETKPQQFNSKPNNYRNEKSPGFKLYDSPPRSYNESPPRSYGNSPPRSYSDYPKSSYSDSPRSSNRDYHRPTYRDTSRSRDSFKPSPPDYFKNSRNDRNFDFYSDSSKLAPIKVKTEKTHEQLDESCIKGNKTTTINLSDGNISLDCYECYDKEHSRPYEQCIEVPQKTKKIHYNSERIVSKRYRRDVNASSVADSPPTGREKRQHEDYYDGGDETYGPDSSDYRFGPEHFTDDYPSSYEEGGGEGGGGEGVSDGDDYNNSPEYESEKCFKAKKGDMLCITCENRVSGGTYQQCSYASDPKKNSYERSVSKVYGSPRLPEENRRKQVDGSPSKRPANTKKRPYSRRPSGGPSGLDGLPSDEPAYRNSGKGRSAGPKSAYSARDHVGGTGMKYRGSPSRSHLPNKFASRERSVSKTPASTKLRSSTHSGVRSSLYSSPSGSSDLYGYLPERGPPPSSRAYSTPSSLVPDPYTYDIPDPYSPDAISLIDATSLNSPSRGARNRKNIDSTYDPGYDETFAGLFPELVDADPSSAVALAPTSYDEYPDGDYDEGPERRTGGRNQYVDQNGSRMSPTSRSASLIGKSSKPKDSIHRKGSCNKVRKNKMTCFQCVDEKGTKHEDCMYVAGSEPKTKQLRYREVKELSIDPTGGSSGGQRLPSAPYSSNFKSSEDKYRGKRKYKKYDPEEYNSDGKESNGNAWEAKPDIDHNRRNNVVIADQQNATRDHTGHRISPTNGYQSHGETREKREDVEDPEEMTNSEIERATRKNYDPIPTDPPQLANIGETLSEDGEFSADTELKFDPVLGLSLPKYMLEKSEHEAIFDEVLASGKK